MSDVVIKSVVAVAESLLKQYHFDVGEQTCDQVLDYWLRTYDPRWIRLALIEALYQGRYKTISVEQIMTLWQRRGQPSYRFSLEFEALICTNLPQDLRLPPPQHKSSSTHRPMVSVPLPSPPAPLPAKVSTQTISTSALSTPVPPRTHVARVPSLFAEDIAPVSNSTLSPSLPLVVEPAQPPVPSMEPMVANVPDVPAPSQAEITKFQPAPADSEVYQKLRDIARLRYQMDAGSSLPSSPEEQQTPTS